MEQVEWRAFYIHAWMNNKYLFMHEYEISSAPDEGTVDALQEDGMARRRKEEALETREKLLDAAIEVFHERGVSRPSLTDVARLAGMTRGAVYGHFQNKADVLSALAARVRLPGEALCETETEAVDDDPLGRLRHAWASLFTEVVANPQWQMILEILLHRCELVVESGEVRNRLLQGRAEGLTRMAELIREAVDRGQLPPNTDVRAAARLTHAALIGILQDWLLQPQAFDLARDGLGYLDALLDIMKTAKVFQR